jgi:transcriptional regulator with XRE-family HTH domain
MRERLLEFLRAENKSSAQFAEEIGVQASGISHIISGRNNPSLDFILKMLEKYPFLSTDWLLFGKGSMYKESKTQSLFDKEVISIKNDILQKPGIESGKPETDKPEFEFSPLSEDDIVENKHIISDNAKHIVRRIVWFYDNNSFEEYIPKR